MSIKKKMLEQVNKKAEKIRERRAEAASNKTLESAAFEFFRNIEEASRLPDGSGASEFIFHARIALEGKIKAGFDRGAKVSVEYNAHPPDSLSIQEETVRGVTIWWSQEYIRKNNVDPSLYIDVSQMLFF